MERSTQGTLTGMRTLSTYNFTHCESRLITKDDGKLKLMWNYKLEGFFDVSWAFLNMLRRPDIIYIRLVYLF